jgi:hypothetical protein
LKITRLKIFSLRSAIPSSGFPSVLICIYCLSDLEPEAFCCLPVGKPLIQPCKVKEKFNTQLHDSRHEKLTGMQMIQPGFIQPWGNDLWTAGMG